MRVPWICGGWLLAVLFTGQAGRDALAAQLPPSAPRAPSIVLTQPAGGGMVPQDQPVLTFHFASGDPADVLDLGSLRISVNGHDQTARFRVTPSEAWGPISQGSGDEKAIIRAGAYTVTARICSLRGVCGSVATTIEVTAATAGPAVSAGKRPRGLIGVFGRLLRKIIGR